MKNKQTEQIHIRVDQETRNKWLMICEMLEGKTQTKIFKLLISKIYSSISQITNIKCYDKAE